MTEFDFTLPRGLIDEAGAVHRQGIMRLATAADELALARDRRSQQEPAYGTLVLLARTVIRLGELPEITPAVLENLFSQDLGYLREIYNRINQQESLHVLTECPNCQHAYDVELTLAGES